MSEEDKAEDRLTYKCPVCGQPLRNAGLGELEAEIERREQSFTVRCEVDPIQNGRGGLRVIIRQGEQEASN